MSGLKRAPISLRNKIIVAVFVLAVAAIVNACQNASEIEMAKYLSNGKDIYQARCQNCHGENGEGLGELAPPLTDTTFLQKNKQLLACIIKNGANQEMVIHGKTYHEKMPAFNDLADIDLAQVVVYITNSFGNKQGMYTYEQVANDLSNCK
jgi:mono/diheme cytochrome c family protein